MSFESRAVFVALCIIWGIPYFFIKLAVADIPPIGVAWGRIALGAVILLPALRRADARASVRRHPWAVCAYALTDIIVPFSLITLGEQWISSSLTGVLIATMPLMVVVLSPLFGVHERAGPRRVSGLLIGFVGVVLLLGIDRVSAPLGWLGVGCVFFSTLCYAAAALIVQRHMSDVDERAAVAAALGVGALALLPLAAGASMARLPSAVSLLAVAVLGVLCTALALYLYFYLIARIGAGRAAVVTYVNPAIAAALGVLALHETFGIGGAVGLAMILIGSWLATHRAGPGSARTGAAAHGPGSDGVRHCD